MPLQQILTTTETLLTIKLNINFLILHKQSKSECTANDAKF